MTSPYLDQPTLSETDRMLKKLRDRAEYWRDQALRLRSSDGNPHSEGAAQRCEGHASEIEWAVRRITGEGD